MITIPARCGSHISIGDNLSIATLYKRRPYPQCCEEPAIIDQQKIISATVMGISMYGRNLQSLCPGDTAGVTLEGLDDTFNWNRWVLGTPDHPEGLILHLLTSSDQTRSAAPNLDIYSSG